MLFSRKLHATGTGGTVGTVGNVVGFFGSHQPDCPPPMTTNNRSIFECSTPDFHRSQEPSGLHWGRNLFTTDTGQAQERRRVKSRRLL